jgi:hypothetical protein
MGDARLERLLFARGRLEAILAPIVVAGVMLYGGTTIAADYVEHQPRLNPDPTQVSAPRPPEPAIRFGFPAPEPPSYADVRQHGLTVNGPLSMNAVREGLGALRYEGCSVGPDLAAATANGEIIVHFVISRSGGVSASSDASSSAVDRAGATCIAKRFFALRFSESSGETHVSYVVPQASVRTYPIDRGAVAAALGNVNVQSCKTSDGPTGSGHVRVTFSPDGRVISAVVDSGPFPGTRVGECLASRFRGVRMPAFSGDLITVGKSFTIN